MKAKKLLAKFQNWIDARKKHRLSHKHIQMAMELGLNPKKFGKLDNRKQESWKSPFPVFIERIYYKRFGKTSPGEVKSIEQLFQSKQQKSLLKKQNKANSKLQDYNLVE